MYKISIAFMLLFAVACGASSTDGKAGLEKKKKELDDLRKEQVSVGERITKLETELSKLDTSVKKPEKPKLVMLSTLQSDTFTHYIDLQGRIDADNIAYVAPRNQGGLVKAVYIRQGDYVKQGQLLLKLDDQVARQQLEQATIQLNLAKTLYERRQNLWEQHIGAENDLLQAKANYENLQKNVDLVKDQVNMYNVYAELSGVADQVNIKVGEFFSAQSAATLGIRIVNTNSLKVTVNVPEIYQDRVRTGSNLAVTLPELNKTINVKARVTGKLIDPNSRSFYVEGAVPGGKDFRPNQLAVVRIEDYMAKNAITVPLSTVQNDQNGKFVMVASREKDGLRARKHPIEVGQMYGDKLEVKKGLQAGDEVVTEGAQGLYDGQLITTAAQ